MSTINNQTLLDWAQSHSPESRAALAETITHLFVAGAGNLSDRERALMGDILRKVISDLESAVRRSLSERLADLPDAPHDLIRFLAEDEPTVAFPVLTRSGVLNDQDLIEIIQFRTLEHQLAIAMRLCVSENVSHALVMTGQVGVVEALLRNQNAEISQATMEYLVDEAERVDSFREPLVRRRELGPDLARRLFLWVSAALRNHIVARFELDEASVDSLLEDAALESIDATARDANPGGAARLAESLETAGTLDPEILLRALAMGEINLFVAMFGRASGLRDRIVRRILFAGAGEHLAVACKAIGLDRSTFETLFSLSRSARPQHADSSKVAIDKALAVFDGIAPVDASRCLKRWGLDSDFSAAVEVLETAASPGE